MRTSPGRQGVPEGQESRIALTGAGVKEPDSGHDVPNPAAPSSVPGTRPRGVPPLPACRQGAEGGTDHSSLGFGIWCLGFLRTPLLAVFCRGLSEPQAHLQAVDVLVDHLAREGAAVADADVRAAEEARLRQVAEADAQADLGV